VKAADYAERAGDEAMLVFAHEEAIRFYGYAIDYLPRDSAASVAVRRKIIRALAFAGERAQALTLAAETAQILERLGDLAQELEVRIDWAVESYNLGLEEINEPLAHMLPRLSAPEHASIRIRLEVTRAQLLAIRDREAEAQAILDATGPPDAALDPIAGLSYFATKALLAQRHCDIDGFLENTERMLDITIGEAHVPSRVKALTNAASVLARIGRLEHVDRYLTEAETLARANNFRSLLAIVLSCAVAVRYRRGQLREAATLADDVLAIATDHAVPGLHLAAYGCAVGLATGDEELVRRCYDESVAAREYQIGLAGFAYAERAIRSGRPDDARRLLARALPRSGGPGQAPFDLYLAIARWGDERDVDAARAELTGLCSSDRHAVHRAVLALFEAYAAIRFRQPALAKQSALDAAEGFGRLALPLWEADALRIGGRVEAALEIYRRIGAVARLREVERHTLDHSARDATHGPEGVFTQREREVAELVGAGHSNAEIGDKLGVTVKAVEKHLGAIYKKLEFSSRSKLIVYMRER
jgi:DNA-binding CsgD family transcriptional regulator